MPRSAMKLSSLVVLVAAGALLAVGIGAGQQAAETTTATTTTTAPGTTVLSTTTIEQTTTRRVIVPTTTTSTSTADNTPAWVWVLIGILAVGLIVLVVLLARRGGAPPTAAGQQRRLDGAVATWAAQGWGLESQTADSAILRRGSERMLVSVDEAGHVSTRDLPAY